MASSARPLILGTIATTFALGLTLGADPAAWADTHHFTHPTSGVTCDEWVRDTTEGGVTYHGKCTGTPVGINRDYKYREEIDCDFDGHARWVYGPYKSDGTYSTPAYQCPSSQTALKHHVAFVWI